ncbi:hypothetical protein [Amycolatopsis sp. SID8362]|nr:hypothetical protein [Amycolatopsis sp. SID8362]NBH06689.1 hypothetical protein [Amycolatopsis sp. SID8362]NED43386.1 hypothetical protein [Amycolatopsis sp. SID8362]
MIVGFSALGGHVGEVELGPGLSPPEMGYVLAKRALAFGEEVRPCR